MSFLHSILAISSALILTAGCTGSKRSSTTSGDTSGSPSTIGSGTYTDASTINDFNGQASATELEVLLLNSDLNCSSGQTIIFDGSVWACGSVGETLGSLNCGSGEKASFNGTNWVCEAESALLMKGQFKRARYTFATGSSIVIGTAYYHHNGSSESVVRWESPIAYTFGSAGSNSDSEDLSGSGYWYLYIDDSSLSSANPLSLAANNFVASSTLPTYSDANGGWYNGQDRCIGIFYVNSGAIEEFWHDGSDLQLFGEQKADLAYTDIDNVWVDVTMTAPSISEAAFVSFFLDQNSAGGSTTAYWRPKGSTAATGLRIGSVFPSDSRYSGGNFKVVVNSSGEFQVRFGTSDAHSMAIDTHGFYYPVGM